VTDIGRATAARRLVASRSNPRSPA
jgi:hypothetical protein